MYFVCVCACVCSYAYAFVCVSSIFAADNAEQCSAEQNKAESIATSYLVLIGNDTEGIELIVNNSCASWTNNRKISNFAHLLACGDINLGICFEITFHLENMNYLQTK